MTKENGYKIMRSRYSRLALHRQRDVKTKDFQEYFDYCEECKQIARDILKK